MIVLVCSFCERVHDIDGAAVHDDRTIIVDAPNSVAGPIRSKLSNSLIVSNTHHKNGAIVTTPKR